MKVNQVSVLVSKKIGKNFCSWSLSYGATAEVEEHEHFIEVISHLDGQLREMVSTALPTPNGNGNGAAPQAIHPLAARSLPSRTRERGAFPLK